MQILELTLTLQDDVVISQTSATAGVHKSLDYIPGATILGAIAATEFNKLGTEKAHDIFLSGQVRFGNGLPVEQETDEVGYPTPFCLHNKKDDEETYLNLLLDKTPKGEQLKQLRGEYITRDHKRFKTNLHYTMRTAINPSTGTAADAQLFGYQALRAGQVFRAFIQCDDQAHFEILQKYFANQSTLRIGRSRSAQYGRVKVQAKPHQPNHQAWSLLNNQLVLWLVSDLQAFDDFGQPTYLPSGKQLGLEEGDLVIDKSFIRTRRYSPFNGARKHYDQERQVIAAGSILVYEKINTPLNLAMLNQGLGHYREQGLGQVAPFSVTEAVLYNPLSDIKKAKVKNQPTSDLQSIPSKETLLMANLRAFSNNAQELKNARNAANKAIDELVKIYQSARSLEGVAPGISYGPTSNQWSRVRTFAEQNLNASADTLIQELIKQKDAICKEGDDTWDIPTGEQGDSTMRDWFEAKIKECKLPECKLPECKLPNVADFVRILAHEAAQSARIENARLGIKQEQSA